MQIIKEFCPSNRDGEGNPGKSVCVIRTRTYAHSLAYFNKLLAVARETFPDLDDKDVEVQKYGGDTIKRTCGIEFSVALTECPPGYSSIHRLEFTL